MRRGADTFEVASQIRDKGCDCITIVELGNGDPGDNENFLIRGALIKTNGHRSGWIDRTFAAGREKALFYQVT
jgi:c-di-AMP phosphodiesterase-like protein